MVRTVVSTNTNLKNLIFESVLNDAKNVTFSPNDSYSVSYPEFVKYFENIRAGEINEHNLIVASHFVYGWMPTIIYLDLSQKNEVILYLNAVKSGLILSPSELKILKKAINNSLVGLSKLLHFINPRDYAIWDSNIFKYLTQKKSTYGIDKPELYLEYLDELKKLSEHKNYKELHNLISSYFPYRIYPTRAIELVMFETERNKNKS
ncbi:hypothetical protein [Peijinzhouia sedimentorum]